MTYLIFPCVMDTLLIAVFFASQPVVVRIPARELQIEQPARHHRGAAKHDLDVPREWRPGVCGCSGEPHGASCSPPHLAPSLTVDWCAL